METRHDDRWVRQAQGWAMVVMPAILMLVFILHFRHAADIFTLRWHHEPVPPQVVVPRMIALANHFPLIHDQHVIAYLALPLLPMWALGLYALGRSHRPVLARLGLALSLSGTIYLGGVFGMWTAFHRGLGYIDARHTEGAIATFAAMTAPQGAFLLTTSLAKLFMLGLLTQVAALWGRPAQARWPLLAVGAGCLLFLAFWDIDNIMLMAAALMLGGFLDLRRSLLATGDGARP
jgi:hypothetical protein